MIARVLLLSLVLVLLGAASAQAFALRGDIATTAPEIASIGTCEASPNAWTVVQTGGGQHTISTAGVVTRWTTRAAGSAGQTMRVVILRGGATPYTVVGQSANEAIAPNSQPTFATRIPVAAGDRVAVTASGGPCVFQTASSSDAVHYCRGDNCHNGPGTTVNADQFLGTNYSVNARVFIEPDTDSDGWGDESQDNCHPVSNPGQENTDGDGAGDTCDIDDDNDSAEDSADAFPRDASESRDADADGTGDNADADDDNDGISDREEALAGSDPRNAESRPTAPGAPATPAAFGLVAEGADAGLSVVAPSSIAYKRLRRGLTAKATTANPAALDFELRATPRAARFARFELLIASQALVAGTGERSVRLKPARGLRRRARGFTLQLRVTATDLGGNRVTQTRTIRVR